MVARCEVTSAELFPDAADHAIEWTRVAQLWQSQLPAEGWRNLASRFAASREWSESVRVVRITPPNNGLAPMDPKWTYGYPPVQVWSCFYSADDWRLFA